MIGSTQGLQKNSSRVVFLYLFLKGNIYKWNHPFHSVEQRLDTRSNQCFGCFFAPKRKKINPTLPMQPN